MLRDAAGRNMLEAWKVRSVFAVDDRGDGTRAVARKVFDRTLRLIVWRQ